MAVARSSELEPLETREVLVNNAALIIGGGAAGMTAAITLADQGFPIHLIERQDQLGGNLRKLQYFVPANGGGHSGPGLEISPQEYLAELSIKIKQNKLVH